MKSKSERRTLVALMIKTWSPMSLLGWNVGLCFPRNMDATCAARRPTVWPSASIRCQQRCNCLPGNDIVSLFFFVLIFVFGGLWFPVSQFCCWCSFVDWMTPFVENARERERGSKWQDRLVGFGVRLGIGRFFVFDLQLFRSSFVVDARNDEESGGRVAKGCRWSQNKKKKQKCQLPVTVNALLYFAFCYWQQLITHSWRRPGNSTLLYS